MGHSSGAHIVTQYLKDGCRDVKGQILMSPVDGLDPLGIVENYVITPGVPLNFDTPTLIMPTGLDNVPGKILHS